ncbi:MAG: glycosyltransferase family 2 protein [Parcubacteria group bacterium]|nr:glycosyltransferase family 2 protein [Parcubacteria group bacterium]
MKILLGIFTLVGFNFSIWSFISILRYTLERIDARFPERFRKRTRSRTLSNAAIGIDDVAALIPAHNEAVAIGGTLAALTKILPSSHVYIGSDASTDRTVEIARSFGCHVLDIRPNRGKAGVLMTLLDQFDIFNRYKAVLILDAEIEIDEHFLERALPIFDDPKIVAVAGHAVSKWMDHWLPRWSMFFVAYRIRLWRVLVYALRYGQTWKYTNLTGIIPGGSSMYRTSALRQININAPGLIIEDFNMTFELQRKRLGKIAFSPEIFVRDQEPYTLRDYCKQVTRWYLGYWQTVRRHGFWPSAFWFATMSFTAEMILVSYFSLTLPYLLFLFIQNGFEPIQLLHLTSLSVSPLLNFSDLVIGVFLADYVVTIIAAYFERKPVLMLYGLGFLVMRIIDSFIFLWTIPLAFFYSTEGKWVSPERRHLDTPGGGQDQVLPTPVHQPSS